MPDQLAVHTHFLRVPPYWPQVPTAHRGEPVINVVSIFYGDPEAGRRLTDPLHAAGEAVFRQEYVIPHVQLQHACDDDWRHGLNHYWKPAYLDALPDGVIDLVLHWVDRYPGGFQQAQSRIAPQPVSQFELFGRGGELQRGDPSRSSFSNRTAAFTTNIMAVWSDPDVETEQITWARDFADALAPLTNGAYLNFLSDKGGPAVARKVFGDNYERLVQVKAEYDPDNVFRMGTVDLTRS
jgi:hypothetical protein